MGGQGRRAPIVAAAPVIGEKGKLGEGFHARSAGIRRTASDGTDRPALAGGALAGLGADANHIYWGLVSRETASGSTRDNASFTRPAYIEADLV